MEEKDRVKKKRWGEWMKGSQMGVGVGMDVDWMALTMAFSVAHNP